VADRLRVHWDFADLDRTEARFRELLEQEELPAARAELLTQLARVEGLRGRFDESARLLDHADALAGSSLPALTRAALERGRMLRSSGDPAAALPLFESAFELAVECGDEALAADAAHMAALACERDGFVAWTRRGVELAAASDDPGVVYWLGPRLNNLGWMHYEAGEHEPALDAFEGALRARERDPERRAEIEIARYAVGKTLRALGRADEAAALLEQAVAWADEAGEPDGWFHEELAEDYAALGRDDDAAAQARLALPLLAEADPAFASDEKRQARLRALASEV
jgi:tetratricopeptide (TPR) repeat protein